ncbi:MAG: FmdB family zinc ribbon protein [Nitrospirota bacterium]
MPIYEYLCQSCRHRFEVRQKISDPPVSSCARCGQPVSKVISPPAIMFKGSGWYVTDYSDKLKPTGQAEASGKPANGQAEKKEPASAPATAPSAPASPSAGTGSGTAASSSGTASSPPAKST